MAINLTAVFKMRDQGSAQMRKLTRMMDTMNQSSRIVSEGVSKTKKSVSQLGSSATSASSKLGEFATQVSRLHVSSNGLSASLKGAQSTLIGLAGAYLTAQGAAKAFDATIGNAARYEQSEVAVKAIFNDDKKSNAYMKLVDKMAIDSPLLNSTDMLASSKSLVAMTKNVDELGKAWSIIERLMVLDPTQGTEGATFALKEMWQGDSLSMVERFGLNKGELNRIKKLAIPQQIAEINKMLDGMGITQKTVSSMGETSLGYWAQIQERVGKFMRQVGKMGNSKLGATLGKIVEVLDKADLDGLAAKLDGMLASLVDKAIAFGKFVWKWREPILYAAGAVATFAGALIAIGAISMLANPISLIAFGISAVVVGFKALYDHSEPLQNAINAIGSAFKAVSEVFNNGLKGYGTARNLLEDAGFSESQIQTILRFSYSLKDAFDKIKSSFKAASKIFDGKYGDARNILESAGLSEDQIRLVISFSYKLKDAFDMVKGVFDGIGTLVTGGGTVDLLTALGFSSETAGKVDGQINGIVSKISEFVNNVKSKFGEVREYIAEKISQMSTTFDRLKEIFSKVWDTLVDVITGAWSIIEPFLSGFWNILQVLGDVAMIVFNNVILPAISFLIQLFSTLWAIAQPILSLLAIGFEALSTVIKWLWDNILVPLVDFILSGVKNAFDALTGALEIVQGAFESLGGWISNVYGHIKDFFGFISSVKLPDWVTNGISSTVSFVGNMFGAGGGKGGKKSHYSGLDSVPYDGYSARLHKGERVLTARENREYSEGKGGNGSGGVVITGNQFTVREEADIEKVAYQLAKLIERQATQVG
ncbi:hypothetical protein ACIQ7N_01325 [Lysinibacillus sp. NPDC095746]|uniref:phage tail protein n=1 Tax=Lysinibacillus sp. NPDC095746 TaxID=3364134 RepID=UPI0038019B17